jgi:hypothetical protein
MASVVYILCALTSIVCMAVLWRAYHRTRVPLLYWSLLCFTGLALTNVLLFVDLILVTSVDLGLWRNLVTLSALAALVYGVIFKAE